MLIHSRLFLWTTLLVVFALFTPAVIQAHPPFAPYDDTRFAPITRFGPSIGIEVAAEGLTAPLKGVVAPGQPNRLYVVDQPGILWAVDLTSGTKTKFLDVTSRLVTLGACGPDSFDERGLLGVAFHPNYATNGLLYTYTSEPELGAPTFFSTVPLGTADHQNVVAEWTVTCPACTPSEGNPSSVVNNGSRRELMRVNWPQFNHDGGDLAFGPDRKLYISMGDGGGADDADGQLFNRPRVPNPGCAAQVQMVGHQVDGNAQKLNVPLGKILRIDVDTRNSANGRYGIPRDNPFVNQANVVKEIWAFGFRNPYRMSFDSRSGDLFVGDVGQNDIEEVNVVRKGGNHGWNFKEGTLFFHINGNVEGFAARTQDPARPIPPGLVDPIAQYDTHHEGHSVIGGFVYRGSALRGLDAGDGPRDLPGQYVFGDFSRLFKFPGGPHDYGRLFVVDPGRGEISQLQVLPGGQLSLALLGWGQDAGGELYALGNVSGIPFPNPDPSAGPPCASGAPGSCTGRILKLVPAPQDID